MPYRTVLGTGEPVPSSVTTIASGGAAAAAAGVSAARAGVIPQPIIAAPAPSMARRPRSFGSCGMAGLLAVGWDVRPQPGGARAVEHDRGIEPVADEHQG